MRRAPKPADSHGIIGATLARMPRKRCSAMTVGPETAGAPGGSALERAYHYEGSWYEAIKAKDAALISALIHVRGPVAMSNVVAGLHHAVFDGTKAIVELLLQHGCDVNRRDSAYSGVTALMEAVRKEDLSLAALLLEHGARLDLTDSCGDNVIHWAARYTSGTFVRRFLSLCESKRGVPQRQQLLSLASAKNGKHMTPLDVARTPMLRAYLQKVLDKGSAPPTANRGGHSNSNNNNNNTNTHHLHTHALASSLRGL